MDVQINTDYNLKLSTQDYKVAFHLFTEPPALLSRLHSIFLTWGIDMSLSAWSIVGSLESSIEQLWGGWIHAPQASNVYWWLEIAWGEVPGIVVQAKPSDRVQFMVLDHHSDLADTQQNRKELLHSWQYIKQHP